jgi:hypothetical protein
MIPKQKEMDDIVRTIYTAIENEDHLANTLFVLCGDHGMNEGGNHGGSSPGETSPALVFMSPKLTKITQGRPRIQSPTHPKTENEFDYYRTVEQSDIAPTLAGLLGFPVPRNNLGVFLSEFMEFWDSGKLAHSSDLHVGTDCDRLGSHSASLQECTADQAHRGGYIYRPEIRLTSSGVYDLLRKRFVARWSLAES